MTATEQLAPAQRAAAAACWFQQLAPAQGAAAAACWFEQLAPAQGAAAAACWLQQLTPANILKFPPPAPDRKLAGGETFNEKYSEYA